MNSGAGCRCTVMAQVPMSHNVPKCPRSRGQRAWTFVSNPVESRLNPARSGCSGYSDPYTAAAGTRTTAPLSGHAPTEPRKLVGHGGPRSAIQLEIELAQVAQVVTHGSQPFALPPAQRSGQVVSGQGGHAILLGVQPPHSNVLRRPAAGFSGRNTATDTVTFNLSKSKNSPTLGAGDARTAQKYGYNVSIMYGKCKARYEFFCQRDFKRMLVPQLKGIHASRDTRHPRR